MIYAFSSGSRPPHSVAPRTVPVLPPLDSVSTLVPGVPFLSKWFSLRSLTLTRVSTLLSRDFFDYKLYGLDTRSVTINVSGNISNKVN